ncbi:GntR family transcriptional regulator [Streptomyces sp. NBC_01136]|uniref:GntR family transcriptional regulator n=1 Tax=Streptomyces sp. NBC_01136 TaxID=2903754 RepID=UPI00386E616A|nr:GntR family transcriptional regulator [Streptomyces sp. NBC_01136]
MPTPAERTALYRLYGADDRLLYVGISNEPKERMKAHAADKPWWGQVETRDFEWFETRERAAKAEVDAIRLEQPLHNHAHNTAAVLALLPAALEEPLRPQFTPVVADDRSAAQRMAADIRALTMAGELPTGSRLPTTQDLCTRYKVSNVTVQRGLRILKSEGFAVGRNGSAVYVTSPAPLHLGEQEHYVVTEVSSGETAPPRQAAQALAVPEGELIQREEVLVEVDERPLQIVVSYRRLNSGSSEPTEHLDRVTVRPPTTAELLALQIPEEVPVMRTFRQLLNRDGQALEVQIIVEPGNLCLRQFRTPIAP